MAELVVGKGKSGMGKADYTTPGVALFPMGVKFPAPLLDGGRRAR
jgi:hypothetical protein